MEPTHGYQEDFIARRCDGARKIDPLRIGCGWEPEDLGKPWLLIESSAGDSHPGSVHLAGTGGRCAQQGARRAGWQSAVISVPICVTASPREPKPCSYSLASRELLAMAAEMHFRSGHFDGWVAVSGCDKAIPAHLIAAARLDAAGGLLARRRHAHRSGRHIRGSHGGAIRPAASAERSARKNIDSTV